MALKATVFKARIQLSDMDRHVYLEQPLTMARHPSETDVRLMLRVLAWSMYANERLDFSKGLCEEDEPELWQKSYADEIELWIELGTPDETRLRKACGKAQQVVLFAYGDNSVAVWWQKNQGKFSKLRNLTVVQIDDASTAELTEMTARTMDLAVTISDGQVSVSNDNGYVMIDPIWLQRFDN
ncbi:YaeQ family protein [uncultured Ferrimonas sp.]|uniref:YaeQ family protein n=1 Tax=uncultured Ferrimonas sp. TaxID=432640 RepID=UPI002630EE7F|nr:YaeQ family protein [uncultured Ferrimonas sp.]